MKPQKNAFRLFHFLVPLAVISALTLSGCVSGTGTSVRPGDSAGQLLFDAQKASEANNPKKALEYYTKFLRGFPNHRSVPKALLNMGDLYNHTGDYARAHESFSELMRKYPRSSEYDAANIGLCRSLYDSGKRQDGFACVEKARKNFRSSKSRADLAVLYAEMLAKSGKGKEAAQSLNDAVKGLSISYQPQILESILSTAKRMDPGDIESMIPAADWQEPAATLTLAWGLRLADTGVYRQAETVLQNFLTSFPSHKKKSVAQNVLASIKGKKDVDLLALGGLLPLSGRFAALGSQAMRGVEMAMDIYGEKPGALPIRIRIEDTNSTDSVTTASLKRLNENHILAAVGPLGASPQALRSSASLGFPLITFTQQAGITEAGSNVFRNFLTSAMQVDRLVSHLVETLGLSRFAILYPQNPYGEQFRDLFWDKVVNAGGEITGVEGYSTQSTDFADPIRKLLGAQYKQSPESSGGNASSGIQFEAIFIPDAAERAGMILPQLAYHGIENVQLAGTNLWHSPQLIEIARQHAVGAILPTGFFPESERPEVRKFMERYRDTYHGTPGYLEAVVFDSMMMLFYAMEKSPNSREDLKNFLLTIPSFPGVTGKIHFSATREAETLPYLLKVTEHGFREITP